MQLPATTEHPLESSHLRVTSKLRWERETKAGSKEQDTRYGVERAGARKAVVHDTKLRPVR